LPSDVAEGPLVICSEAGWPGLGRGGAVRAEDVKELILGLAAR
jgi:hypothetical protein